MLLYNDEKKGDDPDEKDHAADGMPSDRADTAMCHHAGQRAVPP